MIHYNDKLCVTLTVSEWLSVQCALSDAWTLNYERNFRTLAADILELKRTINAQAGVAIDAAVAQDAA